MDTLGFLRTILPETGVYFLALLNATGKPAHKAYTSLEEMAEAAIRYDKRQDIAVYHACGSYREPEVFENGKRKYRVQSNRAQAKALWIDIDCGEDKAAQGKGYLSKRLAAKALAKFCNEAHLPLPLIVDSGNGLHCYWLLTKAISHTVWQELANLLQQVAQHLGLLVDPTCTCDFARILRPAGTTNRKAAPKPVVVKQAAEPLAPEFLRDLLRGVVSACRLTSKELPPHSAAPGLNDDLVATSYVQMDSSAETVAERCMQVARIRDTKGDGSYDHWRGVIGLIKHCTEGIELARAWTEERANTGHESVDVLTRYETWSSGPPTCEFFTKANPGGCDGCPHKDKIKSPIVLGRIVPEPKEEMVEALINGTATDVEVPKFPEHYEWNSGLMVRYQKDKDDNLQAHPFCRTLFYPIYRVLKEDGMFSMGVRVHLPDKRIRQVDIDTGLLAAPAKLMEALGHRAELVQTNHKDAALHMTAYLRDSLELLKSKAEELSTMTSFGWKDEMQSFLLGDRLYHRDGSVRRVLVGGYAADNRDHFPEPRGTVESYAKAVNHVFGIKGMEPMQYALCSGFGSILTPFGEDLYHGLLVAITGGDTARGKTTVAQAALYAFGDATKMMMTTEKGATVNAMYARMGAYGSIPMLIDEYLAVDPEALSELCYRVSSGLDRGRLVMGKNGARQNRQETWNMCPYVTANKDLHGILSSFASNSQAEAVRMIQIKIDEYNIPQFGDGVVASALNQIKLNRGCAGEAFVKHVVTHIDDVFALFQDTIGMMSTHMVGPKYRFYRNHAAATLAAAKMLKQLGIVDFDLDALTIFAIRLMKKLCDDVQETNVLSAEDALSSMINDFMPRIITTVEYRDARDARGPEVVNRVYSSVAGRLILGNPSKPDRWAGRLVLSRNDIRDWCVKHRVEVNAVLAYARANGVLVADREKFTLTKGTELPSVNLWCAIFDHNKLADLVGDRVKLVVPGNQQGTPNSNAVSV